MMSRPSAPKRSYERLLASIVAVEFDPEPAMTGTRPATRSTTKAQTASSSSSVMVELSPVVPSVRIASVPFARWKSTRLPSASKSTLPSSSKGVTSATIEPSRSLMFMGYSSPSFDVVLAMCRSAHARTRCPASVTPTVAR